MPQDFIQQLLLILLGLLFFKDLIGIYLNKLLEKLFGVKVNGNGNGHKDIVARLDAFESNHLHALEGKLDEINLTLRAILDEEKNEAEERRELQRTVNEMSRRI